MMNREYDADGNLVSEWETPDPELPTSATAATLAVDRIEKATTIAGLRSALLDYVAATS